MASAVSTWALCTARSEFSLFGRWIQRVHWLLVLFAGQRESHPHRFCCPAPCSPWPVWLPAGNTATHHPARSRGGTCAWDRCWIAPLETNKGHFYRLIYASVLLKTEHRRGILTFFQLVDPLSTHILRLCENVQRPLIIHYLQRRDNSRVFFLFGQFFFPSLKDKSGSKKLSWV